MVLFINNVGEVKKLDFIGSDFKTVINTIKNVPIDIFAIRICINVILMSDYNLYGYNYNDNSIKRLMIPFSSDIAIQNFTNQYIVTDRDCFFIDSHYNVISYRDYRPSVYFGSAYNVHTVIIDYEPFMRSFIFTDNKNNLMLVSDIGDGDGDGDDVNLTCLDKNVNEIIFFSDECKPYNTVVVIFTKKEQDQNILYSKRYDYLGNVLETFVVNYDGSNIIKHYNNFILDDAYDLYHISTPSFINIKKIRSNVKDFNFGRTHDNNIYIINSYDNAMYCIILESDTEIYIQCNCKFAAGTIDTKMHGSKTKNARFIK